jgi:hypothetical protein
MTRRPPDRLAGRARRWVLAASPRLPRDRRERRADGASAYLISKAALVSNVAEVALAITPSGCWPSAGPPSAISSGTSRTARRSRSWPTCGCGSSPRSSRSRRRAWRPIRAATCSAGSSPTSTRSRTFYVRGCRPPIIAALVTAGRGLILGRSSRSSGRSWSRFARPHRIVLPASRRLASRSAARSLIETRAELRAASLDELQGWPDLVALDGPPGHRDAHARPRRVDGPALAELARVRAWRARSRRSSRLAAVTILARASPSSRTGGSTASCWRRCRRRRSPLRGDGTARPGGRAPGRQRGRGPRCSR